MFNAIQAGLLAIGSFPKRLPGKNFSSGIRFDKPITVAGQRLNVFPIIPCGHLNKYVKSYRTTELTAVRNLLSKK